MRALALAVFLFSSPVWGDTPTTALTAGQAAPFPGVLLSEAAVDRVTAGRLELEEGRIRLEALESQNEALESALAEARSAPKTGERCPEPSWFQEHGITIGFIVGVAASGLVVWGAVRVLETRN